jgi:hypothetical protein
LAATRQAVVRTALALAVIATSGCRARDVQPGEGQDAAVTEDANAPGDAPHPQDGAVAATGAVLYPTGHRHSPITASVAARLAAIGHASSVANVFAKVGDSITASTSFVTCFDATYQMGAHDSLAATRAFFAAGNAAGATPFARTSAAATGGWQTTDELAGAPCPLEQEETALSPLYAIVMLGTNDNRYGRSPNAYGTDLWTIVDDLIAAGTIPVLSTIPPVNGDPGTDARVPLFNLIVRAIAQGRQVPLVDFHDELVGLPSRGISSDGLHPTVSPSGACDLTSAGLQYGYNVRNLISLEALDRVRDALAGSPPDASAAVRAGAGTHASPFIATLPLVDLGDTRGGDSGLTTYACDTTARTGRETVYRLDLPAATTIGAYVIERGSVDVTVHVLAGALSASACVASGDATATATVGPGPVYIVVDSRSSASEGEYVLVVEQE